MSGHDKQLENAKRAIAEDIENNESSDMTRWGSEKFASHIYKSAKSTMGDKMFDGYNPSQNKFIENMICLHMDEDSKFLYDWVKKADKIAKLDPSFYVGDADIYSSIVFENESRKVFHIYNSCSCADVTNWIVVWEKRDAEEKIHVRGFYLDEQSDYPKAQYPDKLNLQFYRDRDFQIKYIEKYHMTNKGSVYGDMRDKGYIISISRYTDKFLEENLNKFGRMDLHSLYYFYNNYVHFMYNVRQLHEGFLEKLKKRKK